MKLFSCNNSDYKAGMVMICALVLFAFAMFGIFALADLGGLAGYDLSGLAGDAFIACAGIN